MVRSSGISRRQPQPYNIPAFAVQNIYRSKDVLDIELAGYRIIGFLLDVFTDAIRKPDHAYSTLLLNRIRSI